MPLEQVLLVGAALKGQGKMMTSSLEELRRLAETAGARVAGEFSQILPRYVPATLIGEGKVEEIALAARQSKARTVIFDVELSPAQQKNLESACRAKIIDRTRLILDIFAQRARTSEGRIQVELAQLSYMLPRLTGSWRGFSQQVGGIGTRGPGERKLEYERRHIQYRIEHLKTDLERIKNSRDLRRAKRLSVPVPQVALIGYTNVGKSTLLNTLTQGTAKVYADDKLFATLDPTSRRVRLPEGSWAVVTDTVGFIQRLPTTLIAAFRSTLEEAKLSDCLVIVADATSPDRELQEKAVNETLLELGAEHIPQIRVYNKADLLTSAQKEDLNRRHPERLQISAQSAQAIPNLLRRIQEALSQRWLLRELDIPFSGRHHTAQLYQSAQVLSQTPVGTKTRYVLRLTQENWARLQHKLSR